MATGKPKFYWDSAPLIAWILDEKRPDPAEIAGLQEVVELVERGSAILMTSVLWRAEVLDILNPAQRRRVEDAFDTQAIIELAIDSRVMDLTAEIRRFHRISKSKGALKNIRTPDAIHLASALHYGADEFHTFDGAKPGTAAVGGLLSLNGNVAGRRLKICRPMGTQYLLQELEEEDRPPNPNAGSW